MTDEHWFKNMEGRKVFLISINVIYPKEEWDYGSQLIKEEIIMRIPVCCLWQTNFSSKEIDGKKSFSLEPMHQCHLFQWEKYVYGA